MMSVPALHCLPSSSSSSMQEKGVSGQQMPRGGGQVLCAAANLPGLSRGDGLGLLVVFFWLWPHTATGQPGPPATAVVAVTPPSPSSIPTTGLVVAKVFF